MRLCSQKCPLNYDTFWFSSEPPKSIQMRENAPRSPLRKTSGPFHSFGCSVLSGDVTPLALMWHKPILIPDWFDSMAHPSNRTIPTPVTAGLAQSKSLSWEMERLEHSCICSIRKTVLKWNKGSFLFWKDLKGTLWLWLAKQQFFFFFFLSEETEQEKCQSYSQTSVN